MKIACDKCDARYSLSDDKVRSIGKTAFGIRCKTCGNLIRVRVIEAPVEPTSEQLRDLTPVPPPPASMMSFAAGASGGSSIFADADLEREFGENFPAPSAMRSSSAEVVAARQAAGDRPTGQSEQRDGGGPRGGQASAGAPKGKREDTKLYDYGEFLSLLKQKGLLTPKKSEPTKVEWFLAVDGNQLGPYGTAETEKCVAIDENLAANGYAWREGFADWLPVLDVPELKKAARSALAKEAAVPPPFQGRLDRSARQAGGSGSSGTDVAAVPVQATGPEAAPAVGPVVFAVAPESLPRREDSVLFSLETLSATTLKKKEPVAREAEPKEAAQSVPGAGATKSENGTATPQLRAATATAARAAVVVAPMLLARDRGVAPKRRSPALWFFVAMAVVGGGTAATIVVMKKDSNSTAPAPPAVAALPPTPVTSPAPSAIVSRDVQAVSPEPVRAVTAEPLREVAREVVRAPVAAVARPVAREAPRVVAAPSRDDDEPKSRRVKKRRARRTLAARAEPATARGEAPARTGGVYTPPPRAEASRSSDGVLDDILGSSTRAEPPRIEAPRATARATPSPRREEPRAAPTRPREAAREVSTEPLLPRTLDGAEVKALVERNRHRVNSCYSSTIVDKSEKKGRLVVSFTIERSGRPSRIAVDRAGYWGGEMASCISTAFSRMRFQGFSGDPIEVRFPFVLGDF